MAEFPSAFHDSPQHLVVTSTSEEDFPGVELEQGATNGPDIDSKIVGHTEDYDIHQS